MLRILTLLSAFALSGLAACNTVSGAGKDIERSGQAIEETAKDVQQSVY